MANGGTISLTYLVNNDSFNSKISDMKKNLALLQTECKNSAKEVDLYGNNIANLAKKQSAIQSAIKQTEKIMQTYNTQLDKNKTSLANNQTELTKLASKKKELTAQYKNAVKVYGEESQEALKLKSSLEKVNKEYEQTKGKVATNKSNIQNYTTQLERTKGTLLDLQNQLQQTNKEIEQQGNKFVKASEKFAAYGSKLEKIGGKIQDVGEDAMKAGTMMLGAAGTVAKFASDFETSIAKVNSIAKLSKSELKDYADAIMEVSNNTGQNAGDVANSVYDAISSGIQVGDATGFVEKMNTLSASGFTSLGNAIDVVTTTINAYGMSVEDATDISDKLITTQNLGKVTVDELSQSMGKIIPTANASNVSLDQLCAGYAVLTSQGIKAAESTTYMNSMFNELSDSGSKIGETLKNKTGKSFKELMESGMSLSDILLIINDSAKEQGLQFNELWGSAEAGKAGLGLIAEEGQKFNKVLGEMQNSAGATKEAFDIVSDTSAYKMQQSLTQLKNSFTKLGESLLPFVDDISEGIGKLAEIISNLNPEIVTSVAKFGALLLVFGGVTKGVGSLVTAVGKGATALSALFKVVGNFKTMGSLAKAITSVSTAGSAAATGTSAFTAGLSALSTVALPLVATLAAVATAVYTWHEYQDVMNQSVTKSKEEMSLMERAIAKLTGTTTYSKKELKDMGLIYDDFNENISKDFQKQVENMTLDIHDFGMELNDISLDGVIDDNEVKGLETRVSGALDSCLKAIEGKGETLQSGLEKAFSMDGVIDESETALLEYWNGRTNKEKEEAQKCQNEINAIIANARAEGRALTPEEEEQIRQYYAQIKQIELECQASNSYEIEYAQKDFQNRINTADAATSEKLLKDRYKTYQEQQIATKNNYDTLIAMAMEGYDQMSEEEKKYADETKARLENAKAEELAINQQKYDEDIKYAEEHCENLNMVFNKYTGQRVAAKDVENYQEYELMREHYDKIGEVTESGYKRIYDTATGTWKDLYVSVDSATGQLKGIYDLNTQNVAAMTIDDESALRDEVAAWQSSSEGVLANCITMGTAYSDLSGNIMDESGNIIGHIKQVTDENGNLKESIVDVNGNPIKIGDNANEVINRLKNAGREADALNGKKSTITIQTDYVSNYIQKYNNQGPGATQFETGGTVNESGVYNTQEAGLELIDPVSPNQSAFSLAKATRGELTYIPANSKVTNAAMTTLKMESMIDKKLESAMNIQMNQLRKEIVSIMKNNLNNGNGDFNITMNNPNFVDKGSENANINNIKRIIKSMK